MCKIFRYHFTENANDLFFCSNLVSLFLVKFNRNLKGCNYASFHFYFVFSSYHFGIKKHVCTECGYFLVTPREDRDWIKKKCSGKYKAFTYSNYTATFRISSQYSSESSQYKLCVGL